MSGDPLEWLRLIAEQRAAAGLRRSLRPRPAADGVLDLASNDYLGLARDPRVTSAAAAAAQTWGAGSTGSRLVTGSTELHQALEGELADFVGAGAGLVFSSGYLANVGAVTALSGAGSLIVSDALNHASLVDGCRLARADGADVVVTAHRDLSAVAAALSGRMTDRALVVTDAVFSVDGDLAPLAQLRDVAREHDALLLVDEAHALGVIGARGRGACSAAGISGDPRVVQTLTLSKSLGSQGGAVLGDPLVVEHLVNTARGFIFETALAPAAAGAACAALAVLRAEPGLAGAVRHRARALADGLRARGLSTTQPDGAVTSVIVGDPARAVSAAATLLEGGIRVGCFRPPSVPDGMSRLRLTARADLTDDDVVRAIHEVAAVLASPSPC